MCSIKMGKLLLLTSYRIIKKMDIREKSYYRFKKFTRFLKEKKLYGRFKKKVISVCTRQNKMILFAQPYDLDTNIIETHYMIYYQFHDKEEYREFYEMYEFAMVNDNSRAYYENYQNAIKEWRKIVISENL